MDFLNRSFSQLRDLFLSMTPGARITAGLLLGVVVISLAYLFRFEVAGADVYLLSGEMFTDKELNRMREAFAQEGLDAYQVDGSRIRVARNRRNDFMAALAKHEALPDDFGDLLNEALNAGGPLMSPRERESRLKIAKQQELSRIISGLHGIESAKVMYDEEIKPGLRREKVVEASVIVKPTGAQIEPALAGSIRLLVSKAIVGLEPKDVAVTDWRTGSTTLGSADGFGSAHNNPLIATKRTYEQDLRDKILGVLSWIPKKTVEVDVELDPVQTHQEEEVTHDQPVAVSSSESSFTENMDSTPPAGPPGAVSQQNTPRRVVATGSRTVHEDKEQTERSEQSVVSSTKVAREYAGLTRKRVKVAVTIPTSYFEDIWRRNQPPEEPGADGEPAKPKEPTPADLDPIRTTTIKEIKQHVAMLLPIPDGVIDSTELVSVGEFQDIAPPPIEAPGLSKKAATWLADSWRTLGLILLGLFSLAMVRSMIRAVPAKEVAEAPGTASETGGEQEEEMGPAEAAARQLDRFGTTGGSLRDELSELVSDDPDIAANILRSWIGNPH